MQTMNNETYSATFSKYCIRNAPGADDSLCHKIQTCLFQVKLVSGHSRNFSYQVIAKMPSYDAHIGNLDGIQWSFIHAQVHDGYNCVLLWIFLLMQISLFVDEVATFQPAVSLC